jgi:hypothetical protein
LAATRDELALGEDAQFAVDSALEEERFEPPVPLGRVSAGNAERGPRRVEGGGSEKHPVLQEDRRFESLFLQRRVCLASAFHAYRRKDPAFARSVSLDVTRERDVLGTSRLAFAAFL